MSKSGVEETSVLWCFFNLFGVLIPIDQARLMRGLIEHTVKLKSSDANKLISYAASQGYEITEDRYNAAIKAEDECLTEITRAQV